MKSLHIIGMIAGIVAMMPASGVADFKKPNVKDLQPAIDFDINAEMRDLAWDTFERSPEVALLAVEKFGDNLEVLKSQDAAVEISVIEDYADTLMSVFYTMSDGVLMPDLEKLNSDPVIGEPTPAHDAKEPEPGTASDAESVLVGQISVTTKAVERRCRGRMCFGKEPTVLDVADVSDETIQALQADPFLKVEFVDLIAEAV